ncbi:hypothetical protein LJR168_001083 [Pseudoxanthomonas sp. LjRoot168]|uniref:hypothetical protein n=1 Tax=unclassified Pseudoxanthomonas TaxID=2645906 RepID=UPI0025DB3E54|nr:hypothetical protein [Pseudoxanthomonas sp.]
MKYVSALFAACLMAAAAQAQAQASVERDGDAQAPERAADATAPVAPPSKHQEKPRLSDAHCIRNTGSRIRQRDARARCNGLPGRSYTKDELDRTGQTGLGQALRTLDPSIR